jgi:hypothetical protein
MRASLSAEEAAATPLLLQVTFRDEPAYEPVDDCDELAFFKALILGVACVAPFWVIVAVAIAFVVR